MLERFLDQIGEVLRLCEDTDGILVFNREGIIEYHRIPLNSYWCSQDTVGRHILELYPELDGESSTIRQRSTDLRNLFGLPSIRFTINGAEAEPGSPSGGSLSGEGLSGRSRLYTISGTGALSREDRDDLYVISGAGSIDRMGEQTGSSGGDTGAVAGTEVTVSGSQYVFQGSGWGHQLGMSQYGAYAMAERGFDYDEIVEFYFPGVEVDALD